MNPAALFGRLLDAGADDLKVQATDGAEWSMPIGRWLAPASPVDERVLDRAVGPVIDVGCGPGRHVHALSRRGVTAVGVELSPTAVRHARNGGAHVVEGSIFEVTPDPGLWSTALLLDGNIGIGGHPHVLLQRVAELLTDDGLVLVELDPAPETASGTPAPASTFTPGQRTAGTTPGDAPTTTTTTTRTAVDPVRIRIESDGTTSAWFPWARVTPDAIATPAAAAGMTVVEQWTDGGRTFCTLARS